MSEMVKLSMNVLDVTPSLYEAGKVKIGEKGAVRKSNGGADWQPPVKLDHFIITKTHRGQDGNFLKDTYTMKAIKPDSDGKIRCIPITLLYDDINLNFQSRYACYLGKTLYCSGDGCHANRAVKDKSNTKRISGYEQVQCRCERAEFGYEGRTVDGRLIADKCKITGRLQFIIRGCERIGGVHYFRTTGRNSTTSILSSLMMFQRITGGLLAGIPLDLVVSPKLVADPSGAQQTIQVVSLEFSGGIAALQDQSHQIMLTNAKHGIQIGRIEEEARLMLSGRPAPFAEELDEEDREEFFPEMCNAEGAELAEVLSGSEQKPATSTQSAIANMAARKSAEDAAKNIPANKPAEKPNAATKEPEQQNAKALEEKPVQKQEPKTNTQAVTTKPEQALDPQPKEPEPEQVGDNQASPGDDDWGFLGND